MPIWIPLAIAAAIQTTANIVSNRKKSKVAALNTNLTIAENKKQAELAYQREQENISKLLKYNEPSEQMKRFEQAGLNRNLIYTQGNPGNQSMIAKYNPPNINYEYQAGFDSESLKPLTGLPLAAQQFKLLVSQGKIAQAESTIQQAVAKYAESIQQDKAELVFNQKEIAKFQRIWNEEELKSMFYLSNNKWYLKPEMVPTFIDMITAKWLTPVGKYEDTQTSIAYRKQQLEMLSGVFPWLTPFFNFLRLIKPL